MRIQDLIKRRREELGLSMKEVAEACGVAESSVSRWENGHISEIKRSRIKKLAEVLQVKPSLLIEDEIDYHPERKPVPDLTGLKSIPVLGSSACGSPIPAIREYEYVQVEKVMQADFALVAEGRSMTGCGIMDGSLALFRSTDVVENGAIAAVTVGDSTTIKRFYKYGDTVVLRPCNPDYPDQEYHGKELESIHVFGQIVACLTDY